MRQKRSVNNQNSVDHAHCQPPAPEMNIKNRASFLHDPTKHELCFVWFCLQLQRHRTVPRERDMHIPHGHKMCPPVISQLHHHHDPVIQLSHAWRHGAETRIST
jgi:hypothetical protein